MSTPSLPLPPSLAPVHFVWAKGGQARIVSIEDDAIVVRSSIPSPPGSRLDARFSDDSSEPPCDVRMKVHGSKREVDGTFVLKGRLIDASRGLRTRLKAAATAKTGTSEQGHVQG